MKVETTLMHNVRICFDLNDMSPTDQRDLFIMTLRHLGFVDVLSIKAIGEIDGHLLTLAKKEKK